MPLYKEFEIGDHGLAAIWKIEEPEDFFTQKANVSTDIKNDKRRIEHLAGRYLLKHLEEDFPLHHIRKDEHDKPRVHDDHLYFSISHSWPYVAAVVDTHNEAGIDIQTWHANILGIQHKFLDPREQRFFLDDERLVTLAWCAKEAAYKWNGRRGVDFIEHLPIVFFNQTEEKARIEIKLNSSERRTKIYAEGIINADFAASYIIHCG
jgi:4'-phosphopantetheinyl transferase